ncbi:hypothetical protein, partial [Adhaeribacter aquaticus]|uniref:hypothetical protein n=1 Tax=Adhaeribacter aquaticus TaxID=299567 RepID=UPI00047AE1F6
MGAGERLNNKLKADGEFQLTKHNYDDIAKNTVEANKTALTGTLYTPRIQQVSDYNLLLRSSGTVARHQMSWFFGKSAKTINAIGVFIFRLKSESNISDVRVQVLSKRNGAVTIHLDTTLLAATLAAYNTTVYSGKPEHYERR